MIASRTFVKESSRGAGRTRQASNPSSRRRNRSRTELTETATLFGNHDLASVTLLGCRVKAEAPGETRDEPLPAPPFPDWNETTLATIEGIEPIALPHRPLLEQRFGRRLDALEVYSGPRIEEELHARGAEAAARDRVIFLAAPDADVTTVAHEVVHTLQSDPSIAPVERETSAASEPAPEQEAERIARDVAAASENAIAPVVAGALARSEIAYRTAAGSAVDSPAEPAAEEAFNAALEEGPVETVSAPEPETEAAEPAAEEASLDEEPVPEEAAVEEEPQPTFDLPEMPGTELSPEEAAARKAAQEEAKAAIEQADTASGVVEAFANAPPSIKAATQATIGDRVDSVVQEDQQEFEAELPEFHAQMGGDLEGEEVGEVTAAEAGPVNLEDGVPAPAPDPDVPATPEPSPFRGNEGVLGFLSRLFGGSPADAIGRSLREVKTTDEVETSPGDKPPVPLEGETDPERVDNQHEAGVEEVEGAKNTAVQAVIDGPGPEQARLREMDEVVPMAALAQPELEGLAANEGTETFNQMALPEEVTAQFDQDLGTTMQANLGDARGQFEQADNDRDTQRQQALDNAEATHDTATEEADTEQRAKVLEARRTIQEERQSTINDQEQSVKDLEADAETERAASRKDIQDRVTLDEGKISDKYDQAETDAELEVARGEKDADTERKAAEEKAEEKSWWDRAVDFVKSAFAALTAAINKIFDAVRSLVKGFLEAARDFAKGLIDLAANFIKDAIKVFGEALKGLVNGLLGDIFPGLAAALTKAIDSAVETATAAVDAAADTLKKGVDAIVDGLQKALDAILDVFQGAINAALAVLEAALTGDWAGLAKKVLEAALRLLGISPEAFYEFVGNAVDTIQLILDDPLGFLGNLVGSVTLGFQKFADNFLEHLRQGVIKWLTGALGDIQIPAEFSLAGVLDLARQILGLTWEWIRTKAVKLIGEKNVERVEFLFSYIQTLIEGGFPALFERLKQDLTGLVETVLSGIKEFLVQKVIIAGITWLVSLFNPVGALVKLLFTIWNLIQFLRNQLQRIIQVAATIIESIGNIARGVIEAAATKVESVLANLLPVAIDLVAKLLGLSGVAARVREVIGRIRERVDQAVDTLINRVLKTFRGGGAEQKEEATPDDTGAAGAIQVGEVMTVPVEGDPSHTLSIAVSGTNATVMLASEPLPMTQWLGRLSEQAGQLEDAEKKQAAQGHIQTAQATMNKLDPQADEFVQKAQASAPATGAGTAPKKPLDDSQVDRLQGELRNALTNVFELLGGEGTPVLDIFSAQIEKAHKSVQAKLVAALTAQQERYQTMTWEQVRADLVDTVDVFKSPLLKSHEYGKTKQEKILEKLERLAAAADVPVPEDRESFMKNWVVAKVNNSDEGPYPTAREKLRQNQLDGVSGGLVEALDTAVGTSLRDFDQKNDKPDADMVAAVSGKIIEFLQAVARKDSAFNGLNLGGDKWETVYWGEKRNREWLKARFRRGGGKHEWIPTSYVPRVIERARNSLAAEGAPTAARWITFQDKFRSPTDILMYPPTGRYLRTAPFVRDPQPPHKKLSDKTVTVIQGHVGAVHAPVRDGGYSDDVIAQTKAQGPWHDDLRTIFDANFGEADSKQGMTKIVSGIDRFIKNNLWKGDSVPQPGFNEYYTKTKGEADDADRENFSAMKNRAAGAAQTIKNDFQTARTAVGI